VQADYFLAHGGGWSGDGITLPVRELRFVDVYNVY
jgi:hypothetical protein